MITIDIANNTVVLDNYAFNIEVAQPTPVTPILVLEFEFSTNSGCIYYADKVEAITSLPNWATAPHINAKKQITIKTCENILQTRLDQYAKSWGYAGILSAASYVNSSSNKFRTEGQVLSDWRDQVWLWANVQLSNSNIEITPQNISDLMPQPPTRPVIS